MIFLKWLIASATLMMLGLVVVGWDNYHFQRVSGVRDGLGVRMIVVGSATISAVIFVWLLQL